MSAAFSRATDTSTPPSSVTAGGVVKPAARAQASTSREAVIAPGSASSFSGLDTAIEIQTFLGMGRILVEGRSLANQLAPVNWSKRCRSGSSRIAGCSQPPTLFWGETTGGCHLTTKNIRRALQPGSGGKAGPDRRGPPSGSKQRQSGSPTGESGRWTHASRGGRRSRWLRFQQQFPLRLQGDVLVCF